MADAPAGGPVQPMGESTPSLGGSLIHPQYLPMTRQDARLLFSSAPKPKKVRDYRRGVKR